MIFRIYGLYLRGRLLYVGVTGDWDKRRYQHTRKWPGIWDEMRRLRSTRSHRRALDVERHLQFTLSPPLNKYGTPEFRWPPRPAPRVPRVRKAPDRNATRRIHAPRRVWVEVATGSKWTTLREFYESRAVSGDWLTLAQVR